MFDVNGLDEMDIESCWTIIEKFKGGPVGFKHDLATAL